MGISGKLLLGGLLAALAAASLPGCQEEEAYGFVQIKSDIKLASKDVYTLNGTVLNGLQSGKDLVLKQKTGPGELKLQRRGRLWSLCTFDIARNRVVTATLTPERGTIKCVVQG